MSDKEVMSALGEVLGFLGKLTEKVDTLSVKVDHIESTMATKAELQAVEARLDARIDENRQETVACKLAVAELTGVVSALGRATATNTAAIDALGGRLNGHLQKTTEYINADRREISELRGGLDCLGQRFDALVRPPVAAE